MNRSMSKIRHIQEANQKLEKRLLGESNANKYQINEDVASSFKLGMANIKDPMVKRLVDGILQCAFAAPTKAIDFLRVVTNLFVLIFGEPSESSEASFESYNAEREASIKKLKELIHPCKAVTVEDIKATLNSPELKSYISYWKKKLSDY